MQRQIWENSTERDEFFMLKAINLAKEAYLLGEVPVGAVIVKGDTIISIGKNFRETGRNALHHAEIEAINSACKKLNGWRLFECEIFVTLEPCAMCAGAIINSRIKRLVFGACDSKAGSCGSIVNLFNLGYNHKPQVVSNVLKDDCSMLITDFFRNLRK